VNTGGKKISGLTMGEVPVRRAPPLSTARDVDGSGTKTGLRGRKAGGCVCFAELIHCGVSWALYKRPMQPPMTPRPVTPRDWLKSAILARALAAQLGDIEAKRALEEVADDCELIAQDLGAIIDSLSKGSP
jgi:hypothetical protein